MFFLTFNILPTSRSFFFLQAWLVFVTWCSVWIWEHWQALSCFMWGNLICWGSVFISFRHRNSPVSVCMCTYSWYVLCTGLYSHSVTFFFLRHNWDWLTLVFSSLIFRVHSLSSEFSADVGFHGNVTSDGADGEWEAGMLSSSKHPLESPLSFFFVNYWDVCRSPCHPYCSCLWDRTLILTWHMV